MNPGTLVCGGLSVLLGVVVWLQRSAANKDAESAAAEILRASNDWSTAVLKLDEQSRLAFTLQTQLKILQEAHLAVTNELPTVKGALSLLNSNHAALNLAAQQASNQSRLMLLELIDEKRDALNRASQAAAAEGVAWRSALVFSNQAVAASGQMLELSNQFALVEQERRSLAAELSNPAALRPRLASFEERQARRPASSSGERQGSLKLMADGSIGVVPTE